MTKYILPIFIIAVLILGFVKKVHIYDSFTVGAKDIFKHLFSIFPFICAILILVELFRVSGLADATARLMSPVLTFLGIPPELTELIVIRPLSGNGSIAILERLYAEYGPDSYISRCASIIVGASETVFYIAVVYFSTTKVKKLRYAIPVSLFASFVGVVFSCFLARFM